MPSFLKYNIGETMNFEQTFIGNSGGAVEEFTIHGQGVMILENPKRVVITIDCPFTIPDNRQPSQEECNFVTVNTENLIQYMFAEAFLEKPTIGYIPVMVRTTHPK
jgi:hypothetical protein